MISLLLTLHVIGFTMMVGMIVADFAIFRKLNKFLPADKPRAITMLDTAAIFPPVIGIGAFLVLTTGIGMTVLFKGIVFQMLWFKVKMVLVLIVGTFGSVIPRRNNNRLRLLLAENATSNNRTIELLWSRMGYFYFFQLSLFGIIFLLSIFKF